jgi:hypothetical protein
MAGRLLAEYRIRDDRLQNPDLRVPPGVRILRLK